MLLGLRASCRCVICDSLITLSSSFTVPATTEIYTFPTRRSSDLERQQVLEDWLEQVDRHNHVERLGSAALTHLLHLQRDRKSTRLNSSHEWTWYAVFCVKRQKNNGDRDDRINTIVTATRRTQSTG